MTPSTSSRRSKWRAVAACSWTTKTPALTPRTANCSWPSGLYLVDLDALDACEPRALAQERDELVDGIARALGVDLHVAVVAVAHPAQHAELRAPAERWRRETRRPGRAPLTVARIARAALTVPSIPASAPCGCAAPTSRSSISSAKPPSGRPRSAATWVTPATSAASRACCVLGQVDGDGGVEHDGLHAARERGRAPGAATSSASPLHELGRVLARDRRAPRRAARGAPAGRRRRRRAASRGPGRGRGRSRPASRPSGRASGGAAARSSVPIVSGDAGSPPVTPPPKSYA